MKITKIILDNNIKKVHNTDGRENCNFRKARKYDENKRLSGVCQRYTSIQSC
jgi:hypothetical protein